MKLGRVRILRSESTRRLKVRERGQQRPGPTRAAPLGGQLSGACLEAIPAAVCIYFAYYFL